MEVSRFVPSVNYVAMIGVVNSDVTTKFAELGVKID